jgi:hypothetical protein
MVLEEQEFQKRLAARRIRKIGKILQKDLSSTNRGYWERKLAKWVRREKYLNKE